MIFTVYLLSLSKEWRHDMAGIFLEIIYALVKIMLTIN